MIATQYARIEIAHFLLGQVGIEIDHVNDKGVTTLLIACAGEISLTKLQFNMIFRRSHHLVFLILKITAYLIQPNLSYETKLINICHRMNNRANFLRWAF